MTTIYTPMIMDEMYTVESYENCRRYRWTITRYIKPDGDPHVDVRCEEVDDVGPLTFIAPGPDVDAIATRDLLAMAKEKKRKPREKQDISKMYTEFRERRGRELDTKTVHSTMRREP